MTTLAVVVPFAVGLVVWLVMTGCLIPRWDADPAPVVATPAEQLAADIARLEAECEIQ